MSKQLAGSRRKTDFPPLRRRAAPAQPNSIARTWALVLTASLVKGAEDYLNEETPFWVVRARVGAGQISGLSTLLSGAYIGIDPGEGTKPTRTFEGLEKPPP